VEGRDILQTLAEVAIALAGFTGIFVALRDRSGQPLSGYALVRFRIMLLASLAAVAFALLPFLIFHIGFSPSATWSICSAVVLFFMVPITIHDSRAVRTYSGVMPKLDRRAVPLIALLGAALGISQIANALTLHAFGPYLAAPMWFLTFSAFQFGRLLLSADEPERS
jgi:hypothetical protein